MKRSVETVLWTLLMRRYCQRSSLGSLQASQGRGDAKRGSGRGTERGTDTFKWISGRSIRGMTSYLRLLDCCSNYRRERGWGFLAEGSGLKYPSSTCHVTTVMTRLSPLCLRVSPNESSAALLLSCFLCIIVSWRNPLFD